MPEMYPKKTIFLLTLLLSVFAVQAQKFTASVSKKTLAVGEDLEIRFTIDANAMNFKAPDLSDFNVYSGPNQFSNMTFANGVASQSISLSYILIAKKEGKFTIGPARITSNGKQLQSNSVTVEVVKGSAASAASSANDQSYSSSGSGDEVFVRTSVNKQKCYLGEQLLVTQKIYSLYQLRGLKNYKGPTYEGFWSKEENRSAQLLQRAENIDGTNYYVIELNKTVLFPQKSGTLTIEPAEVEVVASIQSNRKPRSLIEQIFGGGYEDRVFKLKSKKISINVAPLPESTRPESFSGAVGSFNFKTELDRERVKENEPLNLKIVISGKGNINLIGNPKINFPAEFETYDPKVTENVNVENIVSGTKSYEYLLVPRKKGNYSIKNFAFSYFDPEKKQYITIPSPELNITVEPGVAGSNSTASVYVPKNEVEVVENDIRYIKRGDLELKSQDTEFFGSFPHYGILGFSLFAFAGTIVMRRKVQKANGNIELVKERQAGRVARKKLAEAEKLKNAGNKEGFYNEVSVTLYKYISDKMHIPLSALSRSNIAAQMSRKNIQEKTQQKLLKTLDDCEYARFAPSAASDNLDAIYNNTVELITSIENEVRSA